MDNESSEVSCIFKNKLIPNELTLPKYRNVILAHICIGVFLLKCHYFISAGIDIIH